MEPILLIKFHQRGAIGPWNTVILVPSQIRATLIGLIDRMA